MNLRRRLAALEVATARRRAVAIDPALQAELEALPLDALRARREEMLNDDSDSEIAALVARRNEILNRALGWG